MNLTFELNDALTEVENEAISLSTARPKAVDGQSLPRLGLRVPVVRARLKQGYSFQTGLSRTQSIKTWHHIYQHAKLYESRHQAIYYYQYLSLNRSEFNIVSRWITQCDSWEQSDDLSKIYAQVCEENPDWIMPVFARWNADNNAWKRRGSIVGLIEYAQKRKSVQPYEVLIQFVEPLLNDTDYYVQKGIGWTLREIYNLYPEQTWQFLKLHAGDIPPQGYYAATEKLNKNDKALINTLRKKAKTTAV